MASRGADLLLGIAAAAGLTAMALTLSPAAGTANAAPAMPGPPTGEGTLYGDPTAAAPFWRYQAYDDDCVEAAVADVDRHRADHVQLFATLVSVAVEITLQRWRRSSSA